MIEERADIQLFDKNGNSIIKEIFTIVFYIRRPNWEIVQNIERAIWGFVNLISVEALTEYYNFEGEEEELTVNSLQNLIYQRLLGPSRTINADIVLKGKGFYVPEYYLWYGGSALIIPGLEEEVSCFWCWMPKTFYKSCPTEVENYISSLAIDLPLTFGYASFGLAGENMRKKQALAKRYPGLDIADPPCIRADLGTRAAGSYWLTLLGTELCTLVGGIASLQAELPEILVEELVGGKCKIQLGKEPEIGDVNRRSLLPQYSTLAKFFQQKSIFHIPKRVVYFVNEEGLADREAMEVWHRRFLE